MPNTLSVLCVHGVGHEEADPDFKSAWIGVITDALKSWNKNLTVKVDFLDFDTLFQAAPYGGEVYAEAMAKLLASGLVHAIGDLFTRQRGLVDIPEKVRWTAGMVAQWGSDDKLRQQTRDVLLSQLKQGQYDIVLAHSLGSLIAYDTFIHKPEAIQGKSFITFGSQIGNPCVRDVFAGRIEGLEAATKWYHLYNPDDHVLTASIRICADNFVQVSTEFDKPNDILNHDAVYYLSHQNTKALVWREVSGVRVSRAITDTSKAFNKLAIKPNRRALLIGINDYPDPANRLEGCVNDVFLMSSVLQESGICPDDIRVVLNDRATTASIMDRLHWLLDDVRPGDERVLFYSGHGAQMPAYNARSEVDHLDECLVPYDFDWTTEHAITDDQFNNLYSQLPYEARFIGIFDCCHSGGMTREGSRRVRGLTPPDDIRHRSLRWNAKLQMWEDRTLDPANAALVGQEAYAGANRAVHRLGRALRLRSYPKKKYDKLRENLGHKGPYLPVLLEACREDQFSYEYRHGVTSYGAFTFSLAQILRSERQAGKNISFEKLASLTADRLKLLKYNQTPCIVGPSKILKHAIPWKEQK
jgi:hypothetical protein